MRIRSAELTDVDTIVEYNRRLAWETEGYELDLERLRPGVRAVLAGDAEARYLVAERDGCIIGQLMLTREWSDWRNGWFYWIQSVYVDARHRGCGVFRALYSAALDRVRVDESAVGLRLYVEQHNATAQAAYSRLGMQLSEYLVMELTVRGAPVKRPPGAL